MRMSRVKDYLGFAGGCLLVPVFMIVMLPLAAIETVYEYVQKRRICDCGHHWGLHSTGCWVKDCGCRVIRK